MTISTVVASTRPARPPAPRRQRAAAAEPAARTFWMPAFLAREARAFGVAPAGAEHLAEVHALCEEIMATQLAPLSALATTDACSAGTAWVFRRPDDAAGRPISPAASGVILLLPLNWDGEAALRFGRFDAFSPRRDQLCAPGDEIAACYIWITAGRDQRARINLMRTLLAWLKGSCATIRFYARAASPDGARSLAGLGFRRLDSATSTLFFRDKTSWEQ